MSRKDEQKKLKSPDQFQVKAMESVDWITKHGRELAIVVVLGALAVGGVSGYQWYENNRRESRVEELGKIDVAFAKEEQESEKKREALRDQITEIETKIAASKQAANPAAGVEATETAEAAKPDVVAVDVPALEAEKQKLQDQVDAIEASHTGTREQYVEFFKKYQESPEGWSAGMRAVNLFLKEKQHEPARDILLDIVKLSNHEVYKTQGRLVLASIYEDMGKFDEGIELVTEAESMTGDDPELKAQILFAKGRLLYLKDAKADAAVVFDEIITKYATSSEADKARSMKFLLN